MRYILWTQGEDVLLPSTFVIDGKIYKYGDSSKVDIAFSLLEKASQKLMDTDNFIRKVGDKKIYISSNFNMEVSKYGIYLQSCYLNKDKEGRLLPFRFLAYKNKDLNDAIDKLEAYSKEIDRECKPYEINIFQTIYEKYRSKKKNLLISLITIFFIIISLIWIII